MPNRPICIANSHHPSHRSFGHEFRNVFAGAAVWNWGLDGWQNRLRQLADEHASQRSQSTDPIATAWQASARDTSRTSRCLPLGC